MLISLVLLTMLAVLLSAERQITAAWSEPILENPYKVASNPTTVPIDHKATFSTGMIVDPNIIAFFGNIVDEKTGDVMSSREVVTSNDFVDVDDDVSGIQDDHRPSVQIQKRDVRGRKFCHGQCQSQNDVYSYPKYMHNVVTRPVQYYKMAPLKETIPANSPLTLLTWLNEIPALIGRDAQSGIAALAIGQPNMPYQSCTTPTVEPGHCRHLEYCVLVEFIDNLPRFLEYICYTPQRNIGVCCPDYIYPNTGSVVVTEPPAITITTPTATLQPVTIPQEGCGIKNHKASARIVGGHTADPHEWPWMAAIIKTVNNEVEDSALCGGVLITAQHVLTASHCLIGLEPNRIVVRLGEYDFRYASKAAVDFNVAKIVMHEEFDDRSFINDIGILKLHGTVKFNDAILPVCLPPPQQDFAGMNAIVTGWGELSYNSSKYSKTLREVTVNVWTNKECQDGYVTYPILETNLCAGLREGGKDSCKGDSGGPLLYEHSPNRWVVIGIVSWGESCAQPNMPGVYARVNKYLDWIHNSIRLI